ncbi:hypothetical protein AVEN_207960-1 [Araneus ventricosus]|uniref:Uncharacterized protein n=1 Tax=Araneus ventricosus TaxID=182803 RepID=A0A4Y2RYU1_ARAVE|nr:hypothetical protein AVEN_207960-1 [Araneus ventricosus]
MLQPFVFDLIQFLLVIASSISNIQFYARQHDVLIRIAPKGLHVKNGIAFSGLILSILHFISGLYDIIFFFKRIEFKHGDEEEDENEIAPSVSY